MNTNQNKAVYALFNKTGLLPQKENIIAGISNGRTTSSRELTNTETNTLIKYLKSQDPEEQAAEKMRRKIISMAHELHWYCPGTQKINMLAIDTWCLKYSYLKKKLNQYLYNELPKLVSQFENGPYKNYLHKI